MTNQSSGFDITNSAIETGLILKAWREETVRPACLALVAGAIGAVCLAPAAASADWPTRPVRIIAPSSPGGAADTFARLLADNFSEIFRERFYVENRAGAGGLIGAAATARAEPDGYTLVTSSIGYHVIAPAVSPNPGFDPLRDFTHVAYLGGPPNVLVVNPALGVRSFREFLDLARRGEPLAYVSPGVGSHGHLVAEAFTQAAGIQLQHVPHKGAAPAMMDLIAGNVKVGTMTWTTAIGQIRARQVVPVAMSSSARLPEFPDLPTFQELGYPDLVTLTWYALSGPAGLPSDLVQKLNGAVAKIMELPEVRKRLDRDAIETKPMTPDEITAYMGSEIEKWGPVAKRVVQQN
jgi:tripartite-type tricarboxylate transporter receptor subunit TctC